MQKNNSFASFASCAIFIAVLAFISAQAYKKPSYNWDMLPYMAVILSYDGQQNVHESVYNTARQELPAEAFRLLTDSSQAHRRETAQHVEEFNLQMPFYIVKPLYTGLSYLFYKSGFSLTRSTVIPSILAFLCVGLLMLVWCTKYISFPFA